MTLFAKQIGIDLGTSTLVINVRGDGIVVNEPSVIALDADFSRVVAVGQRALEVAARSRGRVRLVRPLRDGVLVDHRVTRRLLHYFVNRIQGRQRLFKPDVMMSIASFVSGRERRALTEAAISAGAKQAWLVEAPLAAAIGAELPIASAGAIAVCDLGAAKTEVAVISRSGVVASASVKVGGNHVDEAIVDHVRSRHQLLLKPDVAENAKIAIGAAVSTSSGSVEVKGSDASTGSPRTVRVASDDVRRAIEPPLSTIAQTVRGVVAETPHALAPELSQTGIVLTGGGALLRGLDSYLQKECRVPFRVAHEPQTCVARGAGAALERFDVLKRNQLHVG